MEQLISHLYQDKQDGHWVIQSNEEHTDNVAKLASDFADEFGMAPWGEVLGKLHDKGKESNAFQKYIRKASGYAPDIKMPEEHRHAYVGGVIARRMYGKGIDNIFVNQIFSHHTGLHDSDELYGEKSDLKKDISVEIDTNVAVTELNKPSFSFDKNDFHHLSRMLFSCLVDADYLDTEAFMDKESSDLRKNKASLKHLLPLLEKYLMNLKTDAKDSEVNQIRDIVQRQCLKMAEEPVGFYSLTVPTGGGKTLSSLVWAIKHAIHNGQRRVIIAIPYTSIIMQTASVLRGIFGNENVLEHHSNVNSEILRDENLEEKMKLASENWDYPIIVTTNVRLFESMFANKPSACRKLHNIVNSVIILDEVQTLPTGFLQPIVDSLKAYNKLFNVSILLTTASQPVLSGMIEGCNPKVSFDGIEKITEIIPEEYALHDKLRRVKLEIDDEGKNYDEIADMLKKHKRVICIVNTRKDAKELFKRLPKEGITLHLSKMMCSAHISETIEKIKSALNDESNAIIRVVSTQLIEAGVDIDFPVVYRQEAGLDSILQAAGRCNREGRNGICTTFVFSLSKEHKLPLGEIQAANNARKNLNKNLDWFSPEAMSEFFYQKYSQTHSFDVKKIKEYLYSINDLYFATAAEKFHLIEDAGQNVIVCWKNSMDLIQQLLDSGPSYNLMKTLSQYSVSVHKTDFEALQKIGVVKEVLEGLFVVGYREQYDENIGLLTDSNWSDKSLII